MFSQLRAALMVFVVLTVVTGVAYPLAVTLIAQGVFPHRANGSLIEHDRKVIGSELIGQQFDEPRYFWSRPSATTPAYNAAASTASNFGPTNPAQLDAVRSRVDTVRKSQPNQTGVVPVDFVTASASGLDPHISPATAEYQVERIAKTRGVAVQVVRNLVEHHT